jgi:hypothetical protein
VWSCVQSILISNYWLCQVCGRVNPNNEAWEFETLQSDELDLVRSGFAPENRNRHNHVRNSCPRRGIGTATFGFNTQLF